MSLIGDFNPALGITLNGGDVSAWVNQGSSGDVDQTTAINQPEFVAEGINGHPALRFAGSEFLEALNNTDMNIGANDLTLAFVFNPTTTFCRMIGKVEGDTGGVKPGYHLFSHTSGTKLNIKHADGIGRKGWGSGAVTSPGSISISISTLVDSSKVATLDIDGLDARDSADDSAGMSTVMDTTETFKIGQAGTVTASRMVGDLYRVLIYDSLEDVGALFTELNNLYSNPPVTPSAAAQTLYNDSSLYPDTLFTENLYPDTLFN